MSQEVAKIILQQMGGNKFTTMVGAKNLGATENSLSFKIACKNPKGITHCQITLNRSDLYDMKFFKIRGAKVETVANLEDIYNDSMQEVFSEVTGLATHL